MSSSLRVSWLAVVLVSMGWAGLARAADVPFRITVTKYNIDFGLDDFSAPDPFVKITVNGVNSVHTLPGPCPPSGDCIGPLPPPQEWIDAGGTATTVRSVPYGSTPLTVRITLWDDDAPLPDDPAPITPGDGALDLQVDVRTGKWSGDAVWPTNCIWNGANGVCWEMSTDSDGDGLYDDWERNGVDVDGVHIDLPGMGAHWDHKDVFVELDWVPGFEPRKESIDRLKKAFERAPDYATGTPNPDSVQGITLHVDTGALTQNVAGKQVLVGDDLGGGASIGSQPAAWCGFAQTLSGESVDHFVMLKKINFQKARELVFHYAIAKQGNCEMCGVGTGTADGCGEIGGDDLVVGLSASAEAAAGKTPSEATLAGDAAIMMHELGHNFGLDHGGFENHNCKPNYFSVMNYFYGGGIPKDSGSSGSVLVDYSRALTAIGEQQNPPRDRFFIPVLNETQLDESTPFDTTARLVFRNIVYFNGKGKLAKASLYNDLIDWDGDGTINSTTRVRANIDFDPDPNPATAKFPSCQKPVNRPLGQLVSFDDWRALVLRGDDQGTESVGAVPSEGEPSRAAAELIRQIIDTTDLAVSLAGPAGVVGVGSSQVLTVVVSDLGPSSSDAVQLTVVLPPGISLTGSTVPCTGSTGTVVCDVGHVAAAASRTLSLTVLVGPNTTGAPRIVNVRVADAVGTDPLQANNQASFTLLARPQFAGFDDPARPWSAKGANLALDPSNKTEGTAALRLDSCHHVALDSPAFSTTEWEVVGDQLALDVFVPPDPALSNPDQVGHVQLFVQIPGTSVHNVYLGFVPLTPLPRGAWSTVQFAVPPDVEAAFLGAHAGATLTVVVQSGSCAAPLLIDNLRFAGNLQVRFAF